MVAILLMGLKVHFAVFLTVTKKKIYSSHLYTHFGRAIKSTVCSHKGVAVETKRFKMLIVGTMLLHIDRISETEFKE